MTTTTAIAVRPLITVNGPWTWEGRCRGLPFSSSMVLKTKAEIKTETRRIVKGEPLRWLDEAGFTPGFVALRENGLSPYGYTGDRLWVRESWQAWEDPVSGVDHIRYRADDEKLPIPDTAQASDFVIGKFGRWRPGRFMPRWASRLTLEITGLRIERLQAIDESGARAEGFSADPIPGRVNGKLANIAFFDPLRWYAALWDAINGEGSWRSNPWVWIVSFKLVK